MNLKLVRMGDLRVQLWCELIGRDEANSWAMSTVFRR